MAERKEDVRRSWRHEPFFSGWNRVFKFNLLPLLVVTSVLVVVCWWQEVLLVSKAASSFSLLERGGGNSGFVPKLPKKPSQPATAGHQTGIWINVLRFREGIGGWKITWAELLVLAKELNATLVEPQVTRGKLFSGRPGNVLLSDIYNRTIMTNYHPKIATLEEFETAMENNPPVFKLCMQNQNKGGSCEQWSATLLSEQNEPYSRTIVKVRKASANFQMVVLEIDMLWKRSLSNFAVSEESSVKLISESQVEHVMKHHLKFNWKLYDVVDKGLGKLNISQQEDYSVIHWRAETPNIDYLQCAKEIIRVKAAMSRHDQQPMPFILMSSLSMDPELEWWGARKQAQNSTAHEALALLLEDDKFQMMDFAVQMDDMVLNSVVDWIVAEKAKSFATCESGSRACSGICRACNHIGKFGEAAVQLRQEVGKHSWRCWTKQSSN